MKPPALTHPYKKRPSNASDADRLVKKMYKLSPRREFFYFIHGMDLLDTGHLENIFLLVDIQEHVQAQLL